MRAILTGLVLSLACLALLSVGRADASSVDLRDTPQTEDAELRSLAAAALVTRDRKAATALAGALLDDGVSVARVLDREAAAAAKKSLEEAAADSHRQGVALPYLVALGDVDGLAARLGERSLGDNLRLGVIEALARIASDEAIDRLRAFGRDAGEDEELRKAAWRAVRRGQRQQRAATKPPRRSRWEVQP